MRTYTLALLRRKDFHRLPEEINQTSRFVLARDYDALSAQLKEAREHIKKLADHCDGYLRFAKFTHVARRAVECHQHDARTFLSAHAENDANSTPPPSDP